MSYELNIKDEQITELLLRGWESKEIAKKLGIRLRTVKGRFNRMFKRYGITTGVKRVKLAVLLYRKELEGEK